MIVFFTYTVIPLLIFAPWCITLNVLAWLIQTWGNFVDRMIM